MVVCEGEKLEIHCKAFGTNPQIVWTVGKLKSALNMEKDAYFE